LPHCTKFMPVGAASDYSLALTLLMRIALKIG
jgi:hypothetical protein